MRPSLWSQLFTLPTWLRVACVQAAAEDTENLHKYHGDFNGRGDSQEILQSLCPDYTQYALHYHKPYSEGPLKLPSQRPHPHCRKFSSPAVEKVIEDLFPKIKDPDLAQIFKNAFPNTLDTTVRWHVDGVKSHAKITLARDKDRWKGPQSFIVTGDINAEWLRDSTNQLAQYQLLAKTAPEISNLILGAINTQAEYVSTAPYCNAFQPPNPSGLKPVHSGQEDYVHPQYEPSVVFECKYELDSLANFLSLTNQYYASTGSTAFLTAQWYKALNTVLSVLDQQAMPTFDPDTLQYVRNVYTFSRNTRVGTETLDLEGTGNPLANGTGLVRSAFRPSDDATIFGFLIPANAMMSVELSRISKLLVSAAASLPAAEGKHLKTAAANIQARSDTIKDGIYKHAVVTHPVFGKVFAYEVDGYGSRLLIDDANVPSLLSLPLLGFVDATDEIYQNTRRMILSAQGNPYYLSGPHFSGIGGPHIGLRNAWPMAVLVQAMTSDDSAEILDCLDRVKNVSVFGLINESINVEGGSWAGGGGGNGMTRSWFAWANSVFAQTVLWLAEKRPELVLVEGSGRYIVGKGFVR